LVDTLNLERARYLLGNYAYLEQQKVTQLQTLRAYETRVILLE